MDWHFLGRRFSALIMVTFKFEDMQSGYMGVISGIYHYSILTADVYFGWKCVITGITCPAITTHHFTTRHTSQPSAVIHHFLLREYPLHVTQYLQKMTYMICDLCTSCWSWCLFEELWCESLKEEVQLTKWGDLVSFRTAYVFAATF